MQQVKEMVAARVSVSTAIKESLAMSQTAFADKYGLGRTTTSERLNLERAPDVSTCEALSKELGGAPYEWALFLWEAARPSEDRFNAAAASADAA